MKTVYDAFDLQEQEEYDYIVVGGVIEGCPLAATLWEKYSVLVLERGSFQLHNQRCETPPGYWPILRKKTMAPRQLNGSLQKMGLQM